MKKLIFFIPVVVITLGVITIVFLQEKPVNQPKVTQNERVKVEVTSQDNKSNNIKLLEEKKNTKPVAERPAIILPEGAKIVKDPMADFVTELGYKQSALEKFTQFTGKDVLLLEELPDDEKRSTKQDLEDIQFYGFAKVSNRSAELFYDSENYITNSNVPLEQLGFQHVDISNDLKSLGYNYIGAISPHEDTYSQAAWNSFIQVYKKGEDLISVDQGSLGKGGTAFITEGYDNVYLHKEYPASYLKNQSEDGLAYYSLYFSSGKSVYELKSSTDNKNNLVLLAEAILKKDLDELN